MARDIEIVRGDWEKLELGAERAATLLQDRLFAIDREVRLLFPLDAEEHKLKVFRMLGAAIYGLSDPEVLAPILGLLGRKLVDLGLRDHHYASLAAALTWTLRQRLGDAFDREHEAAWNKICAELAGHMQADT
jgi:hemoglobin-like flavoprotein